MSRLRFALCSVLIFYCSTVVGVQAESGNLPRFQEVAASDENFPVKVPGSHKSQRGYLVVSENPSSASDQVIKLPVVVIKARNPDIQIKRPPVLRLAGGPGMSGLSAAAYPGAYPWSYDRDFIILGQRGTQGAEPELMCAEYLNAQKTSNFAEEKIEAATICRDRYQEMGISVSSYHSAASAADIEALRKVLGIEKISLYGGSYGTRLALTYAREYSENVSSMVLDSPLPHTVSYDDESPENFKAALQKVASLCELNKECTAAFPDLFQRFQAALDLAKQEPWQAVTEDDDSVQFTDRDLVMLINLSSENGIAEAPLMMDAIARRDLNMILPRMNADYQPNQFAWGMRLSFWCSESLPFSQRFLGVAERSFASLDGAVVSPEVCSVWDVPKRPDREKAPTVGNIPTLVIAGELDLLTPPRWGSEIIRHLANSHLAVIPYGRHMETTNWSGDGCAMKIAKQFFENEEKFLAEPEVATSCLGERKAPNFKTEISQN
ncbi:MAG: alpha/beta hydrolase [Aquisalinus sp.]|nr:alpha/beta hydrolase [Aquisalinus sp.]